MVGRKHKQLLVVREDCWDRFVASKIDCLLKPSERYIRKRRKETEECLARMENHSGYYKLKKYQRSWGRLVTVELDRKQLIRVWARDGELECRLLNA